MSIKWCMHISQSLLWKNPNMRFHYEYLYRLLLHDLFSCSRAVLVLMGSPSHLPFSPRTPHSSIPHSSTPHSSTSRSSSHKSCDLRKGDINGKAFYRSLMKCDEEDCHWSELPFFINIFLDVVQRVLMELHCRQTICVVEGTNRGP